MKKLLMLIAVLSFALTSCGGGGADLTTPEGVSKKWCDLTAKMKSAEGAAKDKLADERKAFEKEIEAKPFADEAFMGKVKEITRDCD